MAFSDLATSTVSTKRAGAVVAGKRAAPVTHLENVSVFPIMPIDIGGRGDRVTTRSGLPGQAIEQWETYTENHEHTDDSVTVTQIPDIREGDIMVDGSAEYEVSFVANWPITNLTGFLRISLEENKP